MELFKAKEIVEDALVAMGLTAAPDSVHMYAHQGIRVSEAAGISYADGAVLVFNVERALIELVEMDEYVCTAFTAEFEKPDFVAEALTRICRWYLDEVTTDEDAMDRLNDYLKTFAAEVWEEGPLPVGVPVRLNGTGAVIMAVNEEAASKFNDLLWTRVEGPVVEEEADEEEVEIEIQVRVPTTFYGTLDVPKGIAEDDDALFDFIESAFSFTQPDDLPDMWEASVVIYDEHGSKRTLRDNCP